MHGNRRIDRDRGGGYSNSPLLVLSLTDEYLTTTLTLKSCPTEDCLGDQLCQFEETLEVSA